MSNHNLALDELSLADDTYRLVLFKREQHGEAVPLPCNLICVATIALDLDDDSEDLVQAYFTVRQRQTDGEHVEIPAEKFTLALQRELQPLVEQLAKECNKVVLAGFLYTLKYVHIPVLQRVPLTN